jgi:PleD family two-component response regulator
MEGEEFAFLMPESDETRLEAFFQTIFVRLNENKFTSESIPISMSFGVSLHDSARKVNKSLEIADQYLYQAKNTGKNQVHFECGKVMKNHDTKLKSVFVS